ncbi:MAG: alpha/beta fold hydrolase [Vicinamibacterales bacterium]
MAIAALLGTVLSTFRAVDAVAAAGQDNAAQAAASPAEGDRDFTVFLGGTRVGVERVRLAKAGNTWIISSTAQFAAPLNMTVNRFEVKYTADWQPLELHVEAMRSGRQMTLATSFGVTTAVNEITQNGTTRSKTDQVSARTIVLPNSFFAGYEALAARLAAAASGTELRAYVAPQAEIVVNVKGIASEQLPSPAGLIAARRYDLVFQNPGAPLDASVTIDSLARLVRVEIPSAGLRVVRTELAGVAVRSQPVRNPTDTDVIIPAPGFTLAATMTAPPGMGKLRLPVIVLVAGSGSVDRDEVVAGVPIFAQLARGLADKGFLVLRYDTRGVGQSGGRSERVTLQDYTDDLITIVKWLAKRKDIDPKRITVAGHSEGGAVAMLAAAREEQISSLVLIAAPGVPGADLILEQQKHALDLMGAPEAERKAKIELQTRIQEAVITDKGWESIPPQLREQADTPWFKSLLLFEPAKVMEKIEQPILIIQGDLDQQVFPHNADQLAALARTRKKSPPPEAIHLPGINHLLIPAKTGDVAEYGALPDKNVAPEVAKAIADWLKK